MGVELHRIYECRVEDVQESMDVKEFNEDNYKGKDIYDGYTVKVWFDWETPYRIFQNGKWEKSAKCKYKWVMARWYHPLEPTEQNHHTHSIKQEKDMTRYDEPILGKNGELLEESYIYHDSGGIIRDKYVGCRGYMPSEMSFEGKGLPDDMSEDAKKYFDAMEDTFFGFTYTTCDHLDNIIDYVKEKLLSKLKEQKHASELKLIDKKLDIIFQRTKDQYNDYEWPPKIEEDEEDDYDDEETIDDLYWEIRNLQSEYSRAMSFTDYFIPMDESTRIIYFMSN